MKKIITITTLFLSSCSLNSGLSDIIPDNRPDYKTSKSISPLEIPPDLTTSSIDDGKAVADLKGVNAASLNAYNQERNPNTDSADILASSLQNIHQNGSATWIEIAEKPGKVFKNVKRFWITNGLKLNRAEANIGVIETDWLEPKSKLPQSGISSFIGSLLGGLSDEGVRDKFRTRIDFDGKKSYVYITHYGASEEQFDRNGKIITNKKGQEDNNNFAWVAKSRNTQLEAEMLRRLNLFLIRSGKKSATTDSKRVQSTVAKMGNLPNGNPRLLLQANYNQAWLMLGIAIDRAGFDMGTQNRKQGIYKFAQVNVRKVGFIIKKEERDIVSYEIGMSDQGPQQIVVVKSVNGKKPTPQQAKEVLERLSAHIQF